MIKAWPRKGMKCWVVDSSSYRLPDGLKDRDPVTIVGLTQQCAVVRNEADQEWELLMVKVDTGFSIKIDGQTFHESGSGFADYARKTIQEVATQQNWPFSEHDKQERILFWRWILERNGHDPDG